VGPRAGLDTVSKEKYSQPRRDSNPDHPDHIQSIYRLSYPGYFIKGGGFLNKERDY
jgi:hypothetical protein